MGLSCRFDPRNVTPEATTYVAYRFPRHPRLVAQDLIRPSTERGCLLEIPLPVFSGRSQRPRIEITTLLQFAVPVLPGIVPATAKRAWPFVTE